MTTTGMPHATQEVPAAPPRGELGSIDLSRIAQDLQIRKTQVEAVARLLDEGNTIPFITRYRKERTGGLDEEVLRVIADRVAAARQLNDRKAFILRTIEAQHKDKLTDELRRAILAADNPKRLEDLYHPYKRKRNTLAETARQRGLEALAMAIWTADAVVANLEEVLPTLINPEQELNTTDAVLEGAGHILAELIADAADVRGAVRYILWESGKLVTTKNEKLGEGQGQEYRDYFAFSEPLKVIPPHRVLALNRGEKDNALTAKIEWDAPAGRWWALERLPFPRKDEPKPEETEGDTPHGSRRGAQPFVSRMPELEAHPHRAFIEHVAEDALSRLLVPSLEREIRRELTMRAESHAVSVFARNLRSKLLAAPLRGKRVLAIDPAFRTGCKLAMLDEMGNLIDHGVIFPHQPQNKKAEARRELERMVRKHQAQVIAIGNGTACRETEEMASDLIADLEARRATPDAQDPLMVPPPPPPVRTRLEHPKPPEGWHPMGEVPPPLPVLVEIPPPPPPVLEKLPDAPTELAYVIVNEAGASVYSASPIGREEFPQFDATLRGTVSIGRRLQDPLSELVKIDPQHVGVGLYQHDVNPKHLRESLEAVIESCVNTVGVDLNTASRPLLQNVSGLGPKLAEDIVAYRKANGPFKTREGLLQVPGIGEGRFVQAAGFLKLDQGDEPLDRTWIHPESYPVAREVLGELGFSPATLADNAGLESLREKMKEANPEEIAARLAEKGITIAGDAVSPASAADILEALARPGRDPREDLPAPIFKKGVLKLEDLQAGMELKGTVLNVVDFGAFIDIGLKDSGLVHISQMANRYVKTPHDVVSVGDVVSVWVLKVEGERHRVSLAMIAPGTERKPPERRPPQPRGERAPRGDRPPREGAPEGQTDRPAPRGDRPPPRGDRPQGAGRGDNRGGGRPGMGGGGAGGKRSTLPPRGVSRIGTGAQQRGGPRKPGEQGQQGPGETQGEAVVQQSAPRKAKKQPASLSAGEQAGKVPLNSFSQLAALMASRETPQPARAEPAPSAPEGEEARPTEQ